MRKLNSFGVCIALHEGPLPLRDWVRALPRHSLLRLLWDDLRNSSCTVSLDSRGVDVGQLTLSFL